MAAIAEAVRSTGIEDVTAEVVALVDTAEEDGEFRDAPLTAALIGVLSPPLPRPKKRPAR